MEHGCVEAFTRSEIWTHLWDKLKDDFYTFDDTFRLSSHQNHSISGVWTALLEQLDGGLRVLVPGNMKTLGLISTQSYLLRCFAVKSQSKKRNNFYFHPYFKKLLMILATTNFASKQSIFGTQHHGGAPTNLDSVLPLSAPLSWHLLPRWCPLPSSDGSVGEAHCQNQFHCSVDTKKGKEKVY